MNIILAVHNNEKKMYAYDLGKMDVPESGDYAIVEDMGGYNLVEIVMAGDIKVWYQQIITGHEAVRKKVISIIRSENMQNMDRLARERIIDEEDYD